jgi:hypothetical protein
MFSQHFDSSMHKQRKTQQKQTKASKQAIEISVYFPNSQKKNLVLAQTSCRKVMMTLKKAMTGSKKPLKL